MLQEKNNPWLGLASYEYKDAYRFFGRETELKDLNSAICNNLFTTIYGISGAGKTSLINAGIIPQLDKENYIPVRIRLDHQSKTGYNTQIVQAITAAIEKSGGEIESELLQEDIVENEKLWNFLYFSKFWSKTNHQIVPVIFIDQFEEIFTMNESSKIISDFFETINSLQYNIPPAQTSEFLEQKEGYIDYTDTAQFRMVLIMREDFLARLEDHSYDIPALRKNRRGMKRLNGFQALDVILKPYPEIITRDVAFEILSKVTGQQKIQDSEISLTKLSVDPSILSLFCSELYQKAVATKANALTKELVSQFGDNIISTFYDDTMKLVSPKTVEYLENHLLTYSGFRNSVALEDLEQNGISKEELTRLSEKRLIRIETKEGTERVEFTHDVLCLVAKEHKNQRIQKKAQRKDIFLYARFIFETLLATFAFLFLIYTSYTNVSTITYDILRSSSCFVISFLLIYFIYQKSFKTQGIKLYKIICAYTFTIICLWFFQDELGKRVFIVFIVGFSCIMHCLYKRVSYTSFDSKIINRGILHLWGGSVLILYSLIFESYFSISHILIYWYFLYIFVFSPYYLEKAKNGWILFWYNLPSFGGLFMMVGLGIQMNHLNHSEELLSGIILLGCSISFFYALAHSIYSFLKYDKKTDFEGTMEACFSFKVYKERPFLTKYVLTLFFILSISMAIILIGLRMSDIYTLIFTPIISCVLFLVLHYIFFNHNLWKTTSYSTINNLAALQHVRLLPKRIKSQNQQWVRAGIDIISIGYVCMLILIILGVIAAQYFMGRIYVIPLLWAASLFIMYKLYLLKLGKTKARWADRISQLTKYITIWLCCMVIVPLVGMGYNIFSLPQYTRVYNGLVHHRPAIKLFKIKDSNGLIGVRDRENLVIPVEFSSIVPYKFSALYLGGESFIYDMDIEERYTRDYIDMVFYNVDESLGKYRIYNDVFPQIKFRTIKPNGEKHVWDCSMHLDMDNICSTMLLSNYENFVNISATEFLADGISYRYLDALRKRRDAAFVAKEAEKFIIQTLQRNNGNDSVKIMSVTSLNKIASKLYSSTIFNGLNDSYKYFVYLNNYNLERKLIDTILIKCKDHDSIVINSTNFANFAKYRLYAKDYRRALSDTKKSILGNPSIHNPAYISQIESYYFLQQYDSAFAMIDAYKDKECYLTIAPQWYTHLDTITGSVPAVERIFIGDAVYHDLYRYKKMHLLNDTTSTHYLTLMKKLEPSSKKPLYTNAHKYVSYNGEHVIYYCRMREDNEPEYNYYMYNNKQVSPCFARHSLSWSKERPVIEDVEWNADVFNNPKVVRNHRIASSLDWRMFLVIDVFDKKRKYVDISTGVPRTIPGAFDHAWRFSEGLAVVAVGDKIGVINLKGEYVISPRFKYKLKYPKEYRLDADGSFQDNWELNIPSSTNKEFVFHEGLCPMVDEQGNYGLINTQGEWVIRPQYQSVSTILPQKKSWSIYDAEYIGYWQIKHKGKEGLINSKGKIILQPIYNEISIRNDSIIADGKPIKIQHQSH